jgi:RNA polymerase sigma-70 factor (ECF subfamily)
MKSVMKECQIMQQFENVCIIYNKELQRFIYTLTRKDQFAMEEIYQNTMLGALKGLNYLRDSSKMKAWIFSIAKAESKRYYAANRQTNYDYGAGQEDESAGLEYLFDFTKTIEEKESVRNLINGLTVDEQQLCILHYYYDLPLKEISEILNANYNTVRSMHMRGMTKMRKQLKQQTEEEVLYE